MVDESHAAPEPLLWPLMGSVCGIVLLVGFICAILNQPIDLEATSQGVIAVTLVAFVSIFVAVSNGAVNLVLLPCIRVGPVCRACAWYNLPVRSLLFLGQVAAFLCIVLGDGDRSTWHSFGATLAISAALVMLSAAALAGALRSRQHVSPWITALLVVALLVATTGLVVLLDRGASETSFFY
jgi:hypothetical protein